MPAHPVATRRTTLAGLVATTGAAVSGCQVDPSPAGPGASRATDPDARLIESARAELVALIRACGGRAGQGAVTRAVLAREPRRQLEVLQGTAPDVRGRGLADAALRRRELAAQRRFARWADACVSGPLARVLASTSASIAMSTAHLPEA